MKLQVTMSQLTRGGRHTPLSIIAGSRYNKKLKLPPINPLDKRL